jgi:hypothetical protein
MPDISNLSFLNVQDFSIKYKNANGNKKEIDLSNNTFLPYKSFMCLTTSLFAFI